MSDHTASSVDNVNKLGDKPNFYLYQKLLPSICSGTCNLAFTVLLPSNSASEFDLYMFLIIVALRSFATNAAWSIALRSTSSYRKNHWPSVLEIEPGQATQLCFRWPCIHLQMEMQGYINTCDITMYIEIAMPFQ